MGTDVNVTMLFTTLQVVRFEEAVRTTIRLRKKHMNLCACDSEERVREVGVDLNDTMLMMTGTDLLDGGANTSTVSQRSEAGQTILCVKEDIGKYGMWYGVVCKDVMSPYMSDDYSLTGGHDTVSCLVKREFIRAYLQYDK